MHCQQKPSEACDLKAPSDQLKPLPGSRYWTVSSVDKNWSLPAWKCSPSGRDLPVSKGNPQFQHSSWSLSLCSQPALSWSLSELTPDPKKPCRADIIPSLRAYCKNKTWVVGPQSGGSGYFSLNSGHTWSRHGILQLQGYFIRATEQENWLFFLLIPWLVTMELCC